jgi:hypothetical protein
LDYSLEIKSNYGYTDLIFFIQDFAMNRFLRIMSLSSLFISSLQANSFGQMTATDRFFGSRSIIYEELNGDAVVEGDILLGNVAKLQQQGAVSTSNVGGSRWPNGIIAYEIQAELPFTNKLAILQAIHHWKKFTSLEFVELTSKNRDQYNDYISFIAASGSTCSSYVGRQKGKQEIKLSARCSTMNTVHEIGHALGLWHEQSRADRDYYVRIEWDNIEDNYKFNFDQHLSNGQDFGEYDYQSIMHYNAYAFSKNGQPTIVPIKEGITIGQRAHLSEKDIAAIKAMYPEN